MGFVVVIAEENEVAKSNKADDSWNPVKLTIPLACTSPTPANFALHPSKESEQPPDSAKNGEAQILVADTEAESLTPSLSAVDAFNVPVTPSSTAEASMTPSAPGKNKQIDIVEKEVTVTPTPRTTPPSLAENEEL